ncbi:putative E3 ubiquitin-protein ligase [Agyrium rufum]|nr:putative E3 ubiquitin-protein ligase [Agyrium rufum]
MPSWPSRLLASGPSSASSPSRIDNAAADPNRNYHTRLAPVRTPSLPASDDVQAARSTPPPSMIFRGPSSASNRHGRSVSHPFPSILGGGRKGDRKANAETYLSPIGVDIDTLDDETLGPAAVAANTAANTTNTATGTGMAPSSLPRTPSQRTSMPVDRDLVTGKCATCDSPVRWPRHLDVYRCSICYMINDLKPSSGKVPESPHAPEPLPGFDNFDTTRIHRKVLPLSIDRTKALIDQCLDSYLRAEIERCKQGLDQQQKLEDRQERPTPCSPSSLLPPQRPPPPPPTLGSVPPMFSPVGYVDRPLTDQPKGIFRSLENYITSSLHDCTCLNASFTPIRPSAPIRAASEGTKLRTVSSRREEVPDEGTPLSELDAKMLLLGDVAENGMWWTGGRMDRHRSHQNDARGHGKSDSLGGRVNPRLLRINWAELDNWYHTILSCGSTWRRNWQRIRAADASADQELASHLDRIETLIDGEIAEARLHAQRALLKQMENVLKRPGRPIKTPEDTRFLAMLLANPLLTVPSAGHASRSSSGGDLLSSVNGLNTSPSKPARSQPLIMQSPKRKGVSSATVNPHPHSDLIKRIFGLVANLPNECHQHLVAWFCRLSESHFRKLVELVSGFVTYRLNKQSRRSRSHNRDPTAGLIPDISGPGAGTSAHLHAALGISGPSKAPEVRETSLTYADDWQVKAAAKVMSLLYSANNSGLHRRNNPNTGPTEAARQQRTQRPAQVLPNSDFYNSLLDYADLVADFEIWESRRGKFSFCQYPMFLSIWAKIHIMEFDARRQMEVKAREAFFNSIINRKAISQFLTLKVRRDCLVNDSLKAVSEVVGMGQEDIKKGLRIEFLGEEGVDAGGLRKEWFLLLVREVFDPEHGLFAYDEESHYCYFNPSTFETSDQFFLVGVLFGLAIYNSTILDVALPPFAFRKLLASAPTYTGPTTSSYRPQPGHYTLDDLAEFRPSLAKGLRNLLDYEGDVEAIFCRDFVIEIERFGQIVQVPLCPNGEDRPVTNTNRKEFVDLYVQYLLDTSVARQYEPFKRGFFSVCGGNALSLFQPEEIELLIRGSDEALDVDSLRAVAVYENWTQQPPTTPLPSSLSNGARVNIFSNTPATNAQLATKGVTGSSLLHSDRPLPVLPNQTSSTPSSTTTTSHQPQHQHPQSQQQPLPPPATSLLPHPSPTPSTEPQVTWFWSVFGSADPSFQRRILAFITGSDRIPAMGAVNLVIKIQFLGEDWTRFPVARTCFNTLGLWRYRSRGELEGRLRRAVLEGGVGFGLK